MAKRFAFRLERLLELRRMTEERLKRELGVANRAVYEQQRSILQLLIEEDRTKGELRKIKVSTLDLVGIRMQEQYLNAVGRKILREYRQLQSLQESATHKRRELTEASKGVRVLERLREKKHDEWRREVDLEEQKFLDELGGRHPAFGGTGIE
jgi:flagellar protein FliJ